MDCPATSRKDCGGKYVGSGLDLPRPASACGRKYFARAPSEITLALFSHQQALGKGPLRVDPLRFAPEAGISRQLKNLTPRIFVAALGPDSFACPEADGKACRRNGDGLLPGR